MFTGIIEELGKIEELKKGKNGIALTIRAGKVLEGTKEGDSINVNGVCLTVTGITAHGFQTDVVRETMLKTTFSDIRRGDRVNLERALQMSDRLGGHLVTGHIDGTGKILKKSDGMVSIGTPAEIMRYLFPRASIAIDGISLTVQNSYGNRFEVAIIPHTDAVTTLGLKSTGGAVNLEIDMMTKQVETCIKQKGITREFLSEKGF